MTLTFHVPKFSIFCDILKELYNYLDPVANILLFQFTA